MSSWTKWQPLTQSTVDRAPTYAGVYEIAVDGDRIEYPDGDSQTLYYGKADHSVFNRLSRHIRGLGSRIVYEALDEGILLKVRWRSSYDPRGDECELITSHEERFGEKPAANLRGCRIETVIERLM